MYCWPPARFHLRRRGRYEFAGSSSPGGALALPVQSPQQAINGGEAEVEPAVSPHARARELIATLKKQSAKTGEPRGHAVTPTRATAVTPRRMAAVKNVEEVKTPRGGNTQTLYTI